MSSDLLDTNFPPIKNLGHFAQQDEKTRRKQTYHAQQTDVARAEFRTDSRIHSHNNDQSDSNQLDYIHLLDYHVES